MTSALKAKDQGLTS